MTAKPLKILTKSHEGQSGKHSWKSTRLWWFQVLSSHNPSSLAELKQVILQLPRLWQSCYPCTPDLGRLKMHRLQVQCHASYSTSKVVQLRDSIYFLHFPNLFHTVFAYHLTLNLISSVGQRVFFSNSYRDRDRALTVTGEERGEWRSIGFIPTVRRHKTQSQKNMTMWKKQNISQAPRSVGKGLFPLDTI